MKERPILRNKLFLYFTEFFAGMSVMAVELGASRLLAPYFSSSQIVWTIVIGTIMIAMALGNLYGGKSADKDPNPDKLYARVLIAAAWIALIPVLGKYIILGVSAVMIFTVNSNFLIWAAFAACMIIFVFPLFLLGTVTPSLAKYTVDKLEDSGRVVGTLGAANTIGSIIGTFMPTFVTIPTVGTSVTFLIFAGILIFLALVYFISCRAGRVRCIVAVLLFVAASILGSSDSFAFWEKGLVYEGESIYNYLQVKEDDRKVVLSTNVLFGVQSVLVKGDGLTGMYYDYAMAAPLMAGRKEGEEFNILVLGMGTGTYATQCRKYFGDIRIEGVEIDGAITKLARRYFELPEDITIPFQMSSFEFFTLVRMHLKEDGVMVVNMNMRGGGEGNINQYLADTIAQVFSCVYTADVPGTTNRELFASNCPDILEKFDSSRKELDDNALTQLFGRISEKLVPYKAGNYIMTDDKAPVELLGIKVIDEIIREEVEYYRDIYEREGIKGLLGSF